MSDHVKIRIKFQKTGAIRYIGHLDVMRFYQKCLRRAQIPVCYTGGFSPHQMLTFAAPLSVGLESYGEYLDVEVESITTSEDFMRRLNEASIPEIKIVSVKRLPENAGNAMASVAAARYLVSFREGRCPELFKAGDDEIKAFLNDFTALASISYEKEGKKGMREVDLRPGIFSLSWHPDSHSVEMLLDASSGDNVKPAQVLDALLSRHSDKLAPNALKIVRLDTYTRLPSENDEAGALLSMDEIGESF